MTFAIHLFSTAVLPINFWTSFLDCRDFISIMTLILSGLALIPFREMRRPSNFPLDTPNTHWSRFNFKRLACIFVNVSVRLEMYGFSFCWQIQCQWQMWICFCPHGLWTQPSSSYRRLGLCSVGLRAFPYNNICTEGCDEICSLHLVCGAISDIHLRSSLTKSSSHSLWLNR
jgi:hypothetical protein